MMVFPLLLLLAAAPVVGPAHGSLVVVGGGLVGPEIASKFIELAGGKDATIVVIPTAGEDNAPPFKPEESFLYKAGAMHLVVLHTKDRTVADSKEFVAPLKKAGGVWIPGGRQWRLADAYLGTRTEKELKAVLTRGGVIGGTSAGATILGSYLVRGAVEGNSIMMSPGHEQGFGFIRGVAIDQHIIKRHREKDLLEVIGKHPDLLGIGIDESTAIVVRGDEFEVIGASKVAISDNPKEFYFLNAGDHFDLKAKRKRE